MKKLLLFIFGFLTTLLSFGQQYDLYVPEKSASISNATIVKAAQSQSNKLKSASLPGVIWDNGPLVTHPGGGSGGADVSALQNLSLNMNTLGFGFQIVSSNAVADDFVLTTKTSIDSIIVYGYQTNSGITSTLTEVHLQIYDGNPSAGGSLIWGDNTTNRLARTQWSGIYRTTDADISSTARPIMECVCPLEVTLEAGTYYIAISMAGTEVSGPWCPPVTILGNNSTGNGLQNLGGAWTGMFDNMTFTPQAVPFVLIGANLCPEDITISADSSSCGKVVDYVMNTPAGGSVVQTSGLPTGSEFAVGTTTNCFLVTDSLGNTTTCCFNVTVIDSIAPVATCNQSGGIGKAVYISSSAGEPWGVNTNIEAMDSVFGTGNWDHLYYQTLDVKSLLSKNYGFIYMDGGANTDGAMKTFVDANISGLEDWVLDGGNLFLNAAPWYEYEMNWGFSGVKLIYDNSSTMIKEAIATDINHPIFSGPFTPVITGPYSGNYYAHALIPKELNVNVLMSQVGVPENHVLSEIAWGKGKVLFGGITATYFHQPQPEAFNLRANILSYLGTNHSMVFKLNEDGKVTITPKDIDGGSTDNCGIASIDIDRTQFTKADLGEQTVTLIVTDNAGNSSTCQSTIVIAESTKPKAVCTPIDINLDADGTYKLDSLDMVKLTGLAPDSLLSFDDIKIFAYPDTFSCADIEWPVFVRVTEYDNNYNKTRCWAMVTVHDSTPPTVIGKDMEIVLDETGMAMITTEQLMDSATFDGCGIDTVFIDKNTFTCANIGENWVILSATDIHGNTGIDSVLVNVKVDMPVIDSIADVEVTTAEGVCETTINYPLPEINKICGISAIQTAGLGRDGLFPIGTTTESWMIIDYKGDTTLVSFDVTVTATNSFPSFDAIDSVVVDNSVGGFTVLVANISYGNDCTPQTVTVTAESDNASLVESVIAEYNESENAADLSVKLVDGAVGTAKITVTVTDSEGASMFRHFVVVVNETPQATPEKEGEIATAVWTREIEMGVNMYPNPTKDQVTIDIKDYNAMQTEVAVYSITGSEVYRKTYLNGETIRFSMNNQVSGVYLVKMNIDGNNIVKKLVVDKK